MFHHVSPMPNLLPEVFKEEMAERSIVAAQKKQDLQIQNNANRVPSFCRCCIISIFLALNRVGLTFSRFQLQSHQEEKAATLSKLKAQLTGFPDVLCCTCCAAVQDIERGSVMISAYRGERRAHYRPIVTSWDGSGAMPIGTTFRYCSDKSKAGQKASYIISI